MLVPVAVMFAQALMSLVIMSCTSASVVTATFLADLVLSVLAVAMLRGTGGASRPTSGSRANLAIVAGLVALVACAWAFGQTWSNWQRATFPEQAYESYYDTGVDEVALVPMSLVLFVMAPMCEELCYRGVSRHVMRSVGIGPVTCAIVTSLVFAVNHGTLTHLVPTALLGLASSAVVETTGDVRASIAAHMGYNVASAFVYPVIAFPEGDAALVVGSVGCVVVATVSLVACRRNDSWHAGSHEAAESVEEVSDGTEEAQRRQAEVNPHDIAGAAGEDAEGQA